MSTIIIFENAQKIPLNSASREKWQLEEQRLTTKIVTRKGTRSALKAYV